MESMNDANKTSTTRRPTRWLLVTVAVAAVVGVLAIVLSGSKKSDISWLYSQSANSAELIGQGGDKYELVMKGVDIHTIMFADRPDRDVEVVTTQKIVDGWETAFASSAPNAVLVEHEPSGETDSLVVVLRSPKYDSVRDILTYQVELLADEEHPERLKQMANVHDEAPLEFSAVSLFIDNVTTPGGAPVLSGPGASALAEKLNISADMSDPIALGGGVNIAAATITRNSDGSFTASAQIALGSNGLVVNMDAAFTDSQNWKLSMADVAGPVWSPSNIPGLSIDPETITGSIAMTGGKLAWNLTSATHTWTMSTGATYISALTFSSDCPVPSAQCPTKTNAAFIGMQGTLTISGFPNAIGIQGGLALDGTWARLDGRAGNITIEGNGITNATLTVWRGERNDSYDENMTLPDLGKLAGGNNFEFCGGFTLTVPKVANKSTTGCIRWTPDGVVMAQGGNGSSVSGSMPTTGGDGSSSAEIKGFAWTSISANNLALLPSHDVSFSKIANALQNKTITMSGKASLPGVAASAMGIDLKGATSLVFDVRGTASTSEFYLSGDIAVNIAVGSEPMKINIKSITASISANTSGSFSFSVGTTGRATVGYAPQSREINTAVTLDASVAPQIGMTLSINARGNASAADSGRDGLTSSTRLTQPENATYVWPNQFGIKGMNLWNLTIQVGFVDGSPSLAYSSTTYLDPNGAQTKNVLKCEGLCDSSDWMTSSLALNASFTNPCFAYSFQSNSGKSYIAIDGGVLKASVFQVGVAPAGCSIASGSTTQSLPVGFIGFQFTATFGDDPTTINVATKLSEEGFVFQASLDKLSVAGMKYWDISFNVNITSSSSEVKFTGNMDSKMGDASVKANFAANSSGLTQTLELNLTDWAWGKKGTVDLKKFHFKTSADIPTQGGCAEFKTAANGQLLIGSTSYNLHNAQLEVDCKGVNLLDLNVDFTHKLQFNGTTATETFKLHYPTTDKNNKKMLYGEADISYERHLKEKKKGRTFSSDVKVSIDMMIWISPSNPGSGAFEFKGTFDANRVSGDFDCIMDSDNNDFGCDGDVRYNPSWAGVYHLHWERL